MLLTVDVGNTNITLGVFDGDKLIQSWRLSTQISRTEDEYGVFLKNVLLAGGIDKKIIRQKLLNIDSIVVDSFFHFRLGILKARWNDLINLANDNIMYLMSKDTFIELIKFLVSNLEFKCDFVSVKQSGKDFKIYDKDGKSLKDELEDCENLNDVFLITTLISLNPRRIRLDTTNNLKDNTMSLLYEIFNNRVEIFK